MATKKEWKKRAKVALRENEELRADINEMTSEALGMSREQKRLCDELAKWEVEGQRLRETVRNANRDADDARRLRDLAVDRANELTAKLRRIGPVKESVQMTENKVQHLTEEVEILRNQNMQLNARVTKLAMEENAAHEHRLKAEGYLLELHGVIGWDVDPCVVDRYIRDLYILGHNRVADWLNNLFAVALEQREDPDVGRSH